MHPTSAATFLHTVSQVVVGGGPGQGYIEHFWVVVYCWLSKTLTLYPTMFSWFFQPYSRQDKLLRYLRFAEFQKKLYLYTTYQIPAIPYSRPKLSGFYTLSQTNLFENHNSLQHIPIYTEAYIWEYPIPSPTPPVLHWLRGRDYTNSSPLVLHVRSWMVVY